MALIMGVYRGRGILELGEYTGGESCQGRIRGRGANLSQGRIRGEGHVRGVFNGMGMGMAISVGLMHVMGEGQP